MKKRKPSPAQLRARAAFAAKYGGGKKAGRKANKPRRKAKARRLRHHVRLPRRKNVKPRRMIRLRARPVRKAARRVRNAPIPIGAHVHLRVQDPRFKTSRPMPGTWTVIGRQGGQLTVRHPSAAVVRLPAEYAVRANPDIGRPTPLHAVAYVEKKAGDSKPHIYEHVFGENGGQRPKLTWNGRGLSIKRSGSRYTVKGGWIHG